MKVISYLLQTIEPPKTNRNVSKTCAESESKKMAESLNNMTAEEFEQYKLFILRHARSVNIFCERYLEEIAPYIQARDAQKLEEITNKYIAMLKLDL